MPWTLIIFERNEIDTLTLPIAIERARNVWTMCKNETCRWKHLVLCGHFYCSYAIVERLCWNAASFGQRKERGTELFLLIHFPHVTNDAKYFGEFLTCQVRQIRSMESQVKWDMYREERCQTEEERREEAHGTAISADFSWKFFKKKTALGPLDFSWICWIFLLRGGGGVEVRQ